MTRLLTPPAVNLSDGRCLLWTIRLSQVAIQPDILAELDPVERDRLTSYRRREDRDRFVLGCVMVRRLAGAHLGIEPRQVVLDRTCEVCGKPHGKVKVVGAPTQVSVSHSGDVVVVAIHRALPIGVDVERVDGRLEVDTLATVVLAPAESAVLQGIPETIRARAFTTYWTRKEAVLKATGDGMRADPAALVVSPPQEVARILHWNDERPQRVHVQDVPTAADHVAALANLGERPVEITT